jgi:RNA polymerase sigma-70 factor (ECF subfamily)
MSEGTANRALALPLPLVRKGRKSAASRIEDEVIELFDELREPLFRYSLSFGLAAHDCEDVIQESFLALFRHLQDGRPRHNLRGWVFRVTHNLSLKRRTANGRFLNGEEAAFFEQQVDEAPNAERQMVLHEKRARLLAVFAALPEEDRCCVRLRAEGLNYREIAETLGISLGSVAAYLARSLARLARAEER